MGPGEKFWYDLSIDDKYNLLIEGGFWEGFAVYLWKYLPDNLKSIIEEKASQ